MIGIAAVWLYHRGPERYRIYRTAFLVSGAIGLALFFVFPTAPPRLAEMGFADTVAERSDFYRVLQPPPLTNQYAAFPSLHFGWNLLIGVALVTEARLLVARVFGVLLPVAMAAAVLATANHYVVDVIAGAAIALVGLAASHRLYSRRGWRPTGLGGAALACPRPVDTAAHRDEGARLIAPLPGSGTKRDGRPRQRR